MSYKQSAKKTQVSPAPARGSQKPQGSKMDNLVPSTPQGQSFEDEMRNKMKDFENQIEEQKKTIKEQGEIIDRLNTVISQFSDSPKSVMDRLNDVSKKVDELEKDIQQSRCNCCSRQKYANPETQISECNEKGKQIEELRIKKEFQATESKELRLNSQKTTLRKETTVTPRGALNNSVNFPKISIKKQILCVYSDSKLYTDNTLRKLENDLRQEYDVECLYISNLDDSRTKVPDKIFFFYFLTNGREQAQTINNITLMMSNMYPEKPIYLVILKDDKCQQTWLDLQRVNLLPESIKSYKIFDGGFAKFILYTNKAVGSKTPDYLKQVKKNYEELLGHIKTMLKSA